MMRRAYIVYPDSTPRKNNAFGWFEEAAAENGFLPGIFFYKGETIPQELTAAPLPEIVLMRGYNLAIGRYFEAKGVMVINPPDSMELCRDKYRTFLKLSDAALPTPWTSAPMSVGQARERGFNSLCDCIGERRFILKQNFGSKGENVYLISSRESFKEALDECEQTLQKRLSEGNGEDIENGCSKEEILRGGAILVQKYIESSFGKDIRVWVMRGKVAGHILRYNANSFKSNFAAGGSFREIDLPPECAELAIRAARTMRLDFAGIDLLFDLDGFTICEVNGNPGFRTCPTDLPRAIFSTLRNETY